MSITRHSRAYRLMLSLRWPFFACVSIVVMTLCRFDYYDPRRYLTTEDKEQVAFDVIRGLAPPNSDSGIWKFENINRTGKIVSTGGAKQKKKKKKKKKEKKSNLAPSMERRPKQNMTGHKWKSPQDESATFYWRKSDSCFEVDNVCHKSKNDWSYYSSSQTTDVPKQPTLDLRCEPARYDRGTSAERRASIRLNSSSTMTTEQFNSASCQVSSTPYHLVVQSLFNDMMGEFYSRTILNLFLLQRQSPPLSGDETQFYVHFSYAKKSLLDGHELMLSAMQSSHTAKSLVSLIEEEKCECFPKLVFCGYDIRVQYGSASSPTVSSEHNYTLWPTGSIKSNASPKNDPCIKSSSAFTRHPLQCQEWAGVRNFIAENLNKKYPNLMHEIVQHRKKHLLQRGLIDENYSGDIMEWKFVGLAQRTYRRTWLNIDEVMRECEQTFGKQKVACVEVNVEKASTALEQLVMHRALDTLIGVHGAQMTQAVFLPENAHVLELLPWVPRYIRGSWVQTRHKPTPLGIIFHNTDLNHIGYPLDRTSVPMCEGSSNETECFLRRENKMKFVWDFRNFTVSQKIISTFIGTFLLRSSNLSCEELLSDIEESFVLYNVLCVSDGVDTPSIHHFYHAPTKSGDSSDSEYPELDDD